MAADTRHLIRDLSQANPLWGAPRIHGELLKLGIEVAQSTVAKYLRRARKPPSQTWRTFLTNHLEQMASIDFFVVPTATFRLLFVFVVLSHARRRVLHVQVTDHPSQDWTMQQIREAFPRDQGCRYPRDRDGIYRDDWVEMTKGLGIEEVIAAPRSPWQNPFVERLIGSVRRECLDHIIVWNARSLRRTLRSYFAYYQDFRTHLALAKDAPESRAETGFFSALHALRFSTPLHRCCTGTSISFSSRELSACRRDFRVFSSDGVFVNHNRAPTLVHTFRWESSNHDAAHSPNHHVQIAWISVGEFREMPCEDHLARNRIATPNAIRRAASPISTSANCRWLELLPETKTLFWLCGIAYDSKYPHFGHRRVVTGTMRSFANLRPTQKLGSGSPADQFCCWYPEWLASTK